MVERHDPIVERVPAADDLDFPILPSLGRPEALRHRPGELEAQPAIGGPVDEEHHLSFGFVPTLAIPDTRPGFQEQHRRVQSRSHRFPAPSGAMGSTDAPGSGLRTNRDFSEPCALPCRSLADYGPEVGGGELESLPARDHNLRPLDSRPLGQDPIMSDESRSPSPAESPLESLPQDGSEEQLESSAEHSWDAEYGEEEPNGPEEEALERAWDLLDAGEPQKALEGLLQLDSDWPERWIPETIARTQLGELSAASRLLERTGELADIENHPDFLWAKVELRLAEWRIGEARSTLEHLLEVEKSSAALDRLALCAEIEGDFENADLILAQSIAIDPDGEPVERLEPEVFEEVVADAIENLDAQTQRSLERCEIAIEPVPAGWMVDPNDPSGTPPDMLGLFAGESELERSEFDTGALPPRIFLFQRNLERSCRSKEELIEQIRVTLFHEIGHMLGFDEEGVAEMGLE
jgi:predicted Zn-dependent protease with MMP-like domain